MFAVIDTGNITGAVYGIGETPEKALKDAEGHGSESPVVVPCSPEAFAYVQEHGGAPGPRLHVTPRGVQLVDHE